MDAIKGILLGLAIVVILTSIIMGVAIWIAFNFVITVLDYIVPFIMTGIILYILYWIMEKLSAITKVNLFERFKAVIIIFCIFGMGVFVKYTSAYYLEMGGFNAQFDRNLNCKSSVINFTSIESNETRYQQTKEGCYVHHKIKLKTNETTFSKIKSINFELIYRNKSGNVNKQMRSFAYELAPKLENKKDGYYYYYLKAKDFNPFNARSDIMLLRRAAVVGYPVRYNGKCSEIISAEVNVLRETFK